MRVETNITVPTNDDFPLWRGLSLLLLAIGMILAQSVKAQPFRVGSEFDVTQLTGNETDPSVAISPLNPSNIVIVSSSDAATAGLAVSFSTDMGKSWNPFKSVVTNTVGTNTVVATNFTIANGNDGLVPAYGEASVAWDANGNLFVSYLPSTFEGVGVAVSTNGGASFSAVTNLVPFDATDTPRITSPARGAGIGGVWLVYKDYTISGAPLIAQGLQTTGLGQIGNFGLPLRLPSSTAGGFPDISVGPAGQVMVAFQDNITNSALAHVYTTVNTNPFTQGTFGPVVQATANAVGGFTYIAADKTGIGVNAAPGIAWDTDPFSNYYGRAYLVYTGRAASNKPLEINFRVSNNNGASWGSQQQVNDDSTSNDHFFPRIAVDPITALVAVTWYDCRNDLGSDSEQITNVTMSTVNVTGIIVSNATVTTTGPVTASVTNDSTQTIYTISVTGQNMTNFAIYNLTNLNSLAAAGGSSMATFDGGNVTLNVTAGTNGNGATFTIYETNIYPNAFTSGLGSPDAAAIPYGTVSFNGGATFVANQAMIPLPPPPILFNGPVEGFASVASETTSVTGFGHYSGLAFLNGVFYPAWADNADIPTNNPDGANKNFDINTTAVVIPTADIGVFVTNSPNPVLSAGVLVYEIIVTNGGPTTAAPVLVTNTIAPGLAFQGAVPSLGGTYSVNGATVIFTIPSLPAKTAVTNILRVTATASTYATNITTVGSSLTDPVPTNNIFVLPTLIAGEDVALGLTQSETNSFVGDTISYLITVTNLGPSMNGDVIVTNILSPNVLPINVGVNQGTFTNYGNTLVFDLGPLGVGQSTFVLVNATSLDAGTVITSRATVSSEDVDTNLLNNTAQVTATITGEDLALGMISSPSTIETGLPITYSLAVTNFGPSTNENVIISNRLSANLTAVTLTAAPSNSLFLITNNTLVVNLGTLGLDQATTFQFTAIPTNAGFATNIAIAGTALFDTNFLNNTALAINVVTQAPPMIYGVTTIPSANGAIIAWHTDFPGTAQVAYGSTPAYGSLSSVNPTLTNYHAVLIGGLTPGSNYFFNVMSTVNGVSYSSNGVFTTTASSLILNTPDASYTGLWSRGQGNPGTFGPYYQYAATTTGDPTATATYRPNIPTSGNYSVSIWYPQDPSFSTNTQVFLVGGSNETFLSLNQTTNGGGWFTLAPSMYMAAGLTNSVTIENNTGETGKNVVANAMRWSFDLSQESPTNGTVPSWWANFYFGANVTGSADADGDGYSNYAEYVFGTAPNDLSSHLVFTVTPSTTNVMVTFTPWVGGRVYQLQTIPDLNTPIWATLTNAATVDTNGNGVFTVPVSSSGNAFYRLSAHF